MRYLSLGFAFVLLSLISVMSWGNAKAKVPEFGTAQAIAGEDEDVEVRLARAHVEVAKLDLRRVQDANRRMANVYPTAFVDLLKLHVAIDEAELAQCLKGGNKDPHQICIRSAEASVKIAEAELKALRAIHQRMPTEATAHDAKRAEVVAKIARLNLERTKQLDGEESVVAHLQFQIDQLRHQILELQMGR